VVYSYYVLPLQPINIARFSGLITPYVELAIGLGLMLGLLTRLSAIGWMALSILYLLLKLHVIFIQGRVIDCGCFHGLLSGMKVTQSVWIDVGTVILSLGIILAGEGRHFLSARAFLPDTWRRLFRYVW
jgi:hypothetical protein